MARCRNNVVRRRSETAVRVGVRVLAMIFMASEVTHIIMTNTGYPEPVWLDTTRSLGAVTGIMLLLLGPAPITRDRDTPRRSGDQVIR